MAVITAVVLRATQDMLRISATGTSAESTDVATLTQAQLVAAFASTPGASGPLRSLFASPFAEPAGSGGVAVWAALGTTDARLSITQRATGVDTTTMPSANVDFRVISGVNSLEIGVAGLGPVITEFRYNHTDDR